jgi:acyl-CoA thioesterase-1
MAPGRDTIVGWNAQWRTPLMKRAGQIVALGDSLTAGYGIGTGAAYPAALQRRLDENGYEYTVVNAGVSGDTSARATPRYASHLNAEVRILIVALGVNDGLRHVPTRDLEANLAGMIEAAQRRRIAVLLCAMEAPPVYGAAYLAAFHRVYEDLARKYNVPLVPFVMLKVLTDPRLVLPDRIHPNAAGAGAIADQIWPYLIPLLRRIA